MINIFKNINKDIKLKLNYLIGKPDILLNKKFIYTLLVDGRYEKNENKEDLYFDVLKSPLDNHLLDDLLVFKFCKFYCDAEIITLPTLRKQIIIDGEPTTEFSSWKKLKDLYEKKHYYIFSNSIKDKDIENIHFFKNINLKNNKVTILTNSKNNGIKNWENIKYYDDLTLDAVKSDLGDKHNSFFIDMGPKSMRNYFKSSKIMNPIDWFILTIRSPKVVNKKEKVGELCNIEDVFRNFDVYHESELIKKHNSNWKLFVFNKHKKKIIK